MRICVVEVAGIGGTAGALCQCALARASVPALGRELRMSLQDHVVLERSNLYPSRNGRSPRTRCAWAKAPVSWSRAGTLTFDRRTSSTVQARTLHRRASRTESRVGVPVASDDAHALDVVATLVRDVGLDPVTGDRRAAHPCLLVRRRHVNGWDVDGADGPRTLLRHGVGGTGTLLRPTRVRHNAPRRESSVEDALASRMCRSIRGQGPEAGAASRDAMIARSGLGSPSRRCSGDGAREGHGGRVRRSACAGCPEVGNERALDHRQSRCLATRHSICRGVRELLTCGRSRRDARLPTPLLEAAAS